MRGIILPTGLGGLHNGISAWTAKLTQLTTHRALCFGLILLLALTVRTLRYARSERGCLGAGAEQNELSHLGHSLAEHGTFANPFIVPTGATAHNSPVYPLLLAGIYTWLPPKDWLGARVALNIALSSAVCAFAFLAGISLGFGGPASLLGSVLLAAFPSRLNVEICSDQESALIALLAVVAIWRSAELARATDVSAMQLFSTGLVWGFALFAAPPLLLVFACLMVWLFMQQRVKAGLLIAALAVLVLAPWLIRDRLMLGGWVPIRDSLWLELRVSNDDQAVADPSNNAESGAMQLYHPLFNVAAAERIRKYGELHEYDRLRRETVQWVESHPRRFFELTLERFRNFWMPIGTSKVQVLYRLGLYALAALGLALLYRSSGSSFFLACMFVIVYPLPYYLTQSYSRYAYPMEWLVTLLAASAACWALSRLRRGMG